MTPYEYSIIVVGIVFFYAHKFKKLKGHLSAAGIFFYTTLKIIALCIAPALAWVFTSLFLGWPESTVTKIVIATFALTLLVITVNEDRKVGVIDEIIEDAKKDFWD